MDDERQIKMPDDDEISLIDLFAVLWQRRKMIIVITLVAAVGVVAASVISLALPPEIPFMPNKYTSSAYTLINDSSSSNGLSSMINSSGLGGLANLAGVTGTSGPTFSELAVYLVSDSNALLDTVVDKFSLIERYKIKDHLRAASRKALKKKMSASYDEKTGVFSISFTDTDPVFAQTVANFCVTYLGGRFDELGLDKNKLQKENFEKNIANAFREIQRLEEEAHKLELSVSGGASVGIPAIMVERNRLALELTAQQQVYSQLKVQHELLEIAIESESPVFQILELAEAPDQKSGPSRGLLCIIVTFAAGFFSVFLAFVLNALANIRNDKEAMAKFKKVQAKSR